MGTCFGDPVVATALLDRLLRHATVIQIEVRAIDLVPENIRSKSHIQPSPIPPTLKRRRQKAEASIKTTADHPTRQTGEFSFAIIGEIPRAIDTD